MYLLVENKEENEEIFLVLIKTIQMYNSRSSQLVLGAGSVVLKKIQSITAKNLCLLSLIVLLIEKSLFQIDTCLN